MGVPNDPMQLHAFPLVFGGRVVYGSLTSTPIESEDTLAFSVLENIRPMIESYLEVTTAHSAALSDEVTAGNIVGRRMANAVTFRASARRRLE